MSAVEAHQVPPIPVPEDDPLPDKNPVPDDDPVPDQLPVLPPPLRPQNPTLNAS
ncbi:MAG TPA: hypothetical protein VIG66_10865 [Noviherbaspirillum sp.]